MDQTPRSPEIDQGRPRHAARWDVDLGDESCTFITGPAGSGKSTLLDQWFDRLASSGAHPVRYAAVAGAGDVPPFDPESTIGARAAGQTLFIDDAGHLRDDDLDSYLAAIAAGRSDHPTRIVLATRRLPTRLLEWSRGLAIRTVQMDDLEPPDGLIEEIVRGHRPDLSADDLTTLTNTIGQWPAMAHLAGRSICLPSAGAGAASRFDGNDLGVTDYLDTEIFAGLDTPDQHFLVNCSILPVLSADTCAMLTGDQFAEDRLRRLDRQHAFVEPTPSAGVWAWRPLTQTYLQNKLNLRPAEEVADLRRRVRSWSMARRSYQEAATQARHSGDWNVVVRLILDVGFETIAAGDGEAVLGWIDALPPSICLAEAGIGVVAAMAEWTVRGHHAQETIDDWLAHAGANPSGRAPDRAPTVGTAVAITRSLLGSIDGDDRLALAIDADLTGVSPNSDWHALRLSAIGTAAYIADDERLARQTLTECLTRHRRAGPDRSWFNHLFGSSLVGLLALIEQDIGEHERAGVLLSMVGADEQPATPATAAGIVGLANARQSWHDGEHETAVDALLTVAETAALSWVRPLALLHAAEFCRRRGDGGGQLAALTRSDEVLGEPADHPALLARLRKAADHHDVDAVDTAPGADGGLTERELEVLRLLDSDLTRRQIAAQLFLAHNTVKTYIQRLYSKLGVSSRPAALARARERGWLQ